MEARILQLSFGIPKSKLWNSFTVFPIFPLFRSWVRSQFPGVWVNLRQWFLGNRFVLGWIASVQNLGAFYGVLAWFSSDFWSLLFLLFIFASSLLVCSWLYRAGAAWWWRRMAWCAEKKIIIFFLENRFVESNSKNTRQTIIFCRVFFGKYSANHFFLPSVKFDTRQIICRVRDKKHSPNSYLPTL